MGPIIGLDRFRAIKTGHPYRNGHQVIERGRCKLVFQARSRSRTFTRQAVLVVTAPVLVGEDLANLVPSQVLGRHAPHGMDLRVIKTRRKTSNAGRTPETGRTAPDDHWDITNTPSGSFGSINDRSVRTVFCTLGFGGSDLMASDNSSAIGNVLGNHPSLRR
jgi:hypothetical protein